MINGFALNHDKKFENLLLLCKALSKKKKKKRKKTKRTLSERCQKQTSTH